MGKVEKVWFTEDRIFVRLASGAERSQALRFFPRLSRATDAERRAWGQSAHGLHWPGVDEDVSFESFEWGDGDPLALTAADAGRGR